MPPERRDVLTSEKTELCPPPAYWQNLPMYHVHLHSTPTFQVRVVGRISGMTTGQTAFYDPEVVTPHFRHKLNKLNGRGALKFFDMAPITFEFSQQVRDAVIEPGAFRHIEFHSRLARQDSPDVLRLGLFDTDQREALCVGDIWDLLERAAETLEVLNKGKVENGCRQSSIQTCDLQDD